MILVISCDNNTAAQEVEMEVIYLVWGGLPVAFLVAFLMMSARERRDTRADESALDPMFRSKKPRGTGHRTRKVGAVK
jgi:hypothetical protein